MTQRRERRGHWEMWATSEGPSMEDIRSSRVKLTLGTPEDGTSRFEFSMRVVRTIAIRAQHSCGTTICLAIY